MPAAIVLTTGARRCLGCGVEKPFEEFHKHKASKSGRRPRCKECRRGTTNKVYDAARFRRWKLQTAYRMTTEQYEAMKLAQAGTCAICGGAHGVHDFHVDHDHTTGRIRGLLCGACNRGLGYLKDSPEILRTALAYLEDGA